MTKFDLEKRASEILAVGGGWAVEKAVQLAREAQDARAEEIAKLLECKCGPRERDCLVWHSAAHVARSTITKPAPRTREEVLAEALAEIINQQPNCSCRNRIGAMHAEDCSTMVARRALAYRPGAEEKTQ